MNQENLTGLGTYLGDLTRDLWTMTNWRCLFSAPRKFELARLKNIKDSNQ